MRKLGLVLVLVGCSSTSVSYSHAPDAASSDARFDVAPEPKVDARASTDSAIAAGGSGGVSSVEAGTKDQAVGGQAAGGAGGTAGTGPLDASPDVVSDSGSAPDVFRDTTPPIVCVSCPQACPRPNGFEPACSSLPFPAFLALPGCNLAACGGTCDFSSCCTLAGHCGP